MTAETTVVNTPSYPLRQRFLSVVIPAKRSASRDRGGNDLSDLAVAVHLRPGSPTPGLTSFARGDDGCIGASAGIIPNLVRRLAYLQPHPEEGQRPVSQDGRQIRSVRLILRDSAHALPQDEGVKICQSSRPSAVRAGTGEAMTCRILRWPFTCARAPRPRVSRRSPGVTMDALVRLPASFRTLSGGSPIFNLIPRRAKGPSRRMGGRFGACGSSFETASRASSG